MCTQQYYALTAAGVGVTAASSPLIPKAAYLGRVATMGGGSKNTSLASIVLRRLLPQQMERPLLGTRVLGAYVGRALPYLGYTMLTLDAISITGCAYK